MSRRSRRKAKHLPLKIPRAWIVVGAFILIGFTLLYFFGRHFVFHDEEQNKHFSTIAFWVLLPVMAVRRLSAPVDPEADPHESILSVGIGLIVGSLLLAGALVFSAHGYIALFSAATGDTLIVNAKVCCGRESGTWEDTTCDRFVNIVFNRQETRVCLADFHDADADIGNQDVMLEIRRSSVGYNILALSLPAPGVPK